MAKKSKLTVMVTGLGGGGHGEQILKALKMSKHRYTIIGADMARLSMGLYETDHACILPPASAPDYIDCLLRVCKKYGVHALFHGSEPELRAMGEHRERIQAQGIFLPINPKPVIDLCMDKVRTAEFLRANGFKTPAFVKVRRMKDLAGFKKFPAVLKPSKGGGGSAWVFVAQTRAELNLYAGQMLDVFDEFIVQEYVGTADSEYTVGVLTDMEGRLLNSIAVKRFILSALSNRIKVANRSRRKELGDVLAISSGISQGEVGRFPVVTRPCERIAVALGARGAVNLQCRLAGKDVYVFEINPRFSGTTSLRAMVGYNEPDLLLRRHLLGETVKPRFKYREGIVLRGLQERLIPDRPVPYARNMK